MCYTTLRSAENFFSAFLLFYHLHDDTQDTQYFVAVGNCACVCVNACSPPSSSSSSTFYVRKANNSIYRMCVRSKGSVPETMSYTYGRDSIANPLQFEYYSFEEMPNFIPLNTSSLMRKNGKALGIIMKRVQVKHFHLDELHTLKCLEWTEKISCSVLASTLGPSVCF